MWSARHVKLWHFPALLFSIVHDSRAFWQSLGQRLSYRGDACTFARVSSFSLLSIQGIFMSLAFSMLLPSTPFYSLIHYFLTRFPTVLQVQCDRGWDRVFLVGGADRKSVV